MRAEPAGGAYGKMMKLIEILNQITTLDAGATIYARYPWNKDSDATVEVEGSDEEKRIRTEEFRYFLEVSIALDFLSDWIKTLKHPPTDEQICKRVIEYATNDA